MSLVQSTPPVRIRVRLLTGMVLFGGYVGQDFRKSPVEGCLWLLLWCGYRDVTDALARVSSNEGKKQEAV